MKKYFFAFIFIVSSFISTTTPAFAEMMIETTMSSSRVAVGEEFTLDIIVSNAPGQISTPKFPSLQGFNSYSQGRSQEVSIINGETTSRSIFSYVLIANSVGHKTIGPFEITINGRKYPVAAVEVEVTNQPTQASSGGWSHTQNYSQGPVTAPPARALPNQVTNDDIFVKVWLDKDEVYVNEPATLTYTLYTRLSATYKGFEKEPVTTGFWVEDFPPDKTIKKQEQHLNGSRYVVADVRKLALFPTQAGIFTVEPGTLSANVEVRSEDSFNSFFSYNIFGARQMRPSVFTSQILSRTMEPDAVTLKVKALPETGKPANFSGAVGDFSIESSIDKDKVEAGNPVTFRVRLKGRGNIHTLETPPVPEMPDFKIYDSSSSVNISKERLIVEGEKVTDTVIVPKKAGVFTIPGVSFSYFHVESGTYKESKSSAKTLAVTASTAVEEVPEERMSVTPIDKETVAVLGKDIRYLKMEEQNFLPALKLHEKTWYWILNFILLVLAVGAGFLSAQLESSQKDIKGTRFKRSGKLARSKLKIASAKLKNNQKDEFYLEMHKAVYGYFADKLNTSVHGVTNEAIETALAPSAQNDALKSTIRTLLDEIALGRFSSAETSPEHMNRVYDMACEVISLFEKVSLR